MDRCENCDAVIGKLETAHIFQGKKIVCDPCYAKLASPAGNKQKFIQEIELTGKRWKAMKLIGVAFIILGAVAGAVGRSLSANPQVENLLVLPFLLIGIGFIIAARAGAWWNNR
ncbi:MAG: hypothetical protein ACP5QA_14255 [Phycisphaerae bacterium]